MSIIFSIGIIKMYIMKRLGTSLMCNKNFSYLVRNKSDSLQEELRICITRRVRYIL